MASRQIRQRKHTAATVVTILELAAILGLYLTVGLSTGLQLAREKGWLPEEQHIPVQTGDPISTPAAQPDETAPVAPEATPEPTLCPGCGAVLADPAAQFCSACGVDLWNFSAQPVYDAWESSIVTQSGTHDNSADAAVDGNTDTSWQEGVDGDGLGEYIMLDLGREQQVQYLKAWLGNWRSDDWYNRNNVPAQLCITFYDEDWNCESCMISFPKEKRPFGIALSRPVSAQYVCIEIVDVYSGSKYDDTCIAEILVCGAEE